MEYIVETANNKFRIEAQTHKMAVILAIYNNHPDLGDLVSCKGIKEPKSETRYYCSISVLKDMGYKLDESIEAQS